MSGFIYFVQRADGAVKIGYTRGSHSWAYRWQALQGCHYRAEKFLGYIEGGKAGEKLLHWYFEERHVRGEWFKPDKRMFELIDKYGCREMPDVNMPPIPPHVYDRPSGIYNTREAASLCGVGISTIYSWIRKGKIKGELIGNSYQIHRCALPGVAQANIIPMTQLSLFEPSP